MTHHKSELFREEGATNKQFCVKFVVFFSRFSGDPTKRLISRLETERSVTIVYVLVVPFYATHPLVDVIMLIASCYIRTHKVHLM